jgi:hypothetical protein
LHEREAPRVRARDPVQDPALQEIVGESADCLGIVASETIVDLPPEEFRRPPGSKAAICA